MGRFIFDHLQKNFSDAPHSSFMLQNACMTETFYRSIDPHAFFILGRGRDLHSEPRAVLEEILWFHHYHPALVWNSWSESTGGMKRGTPAEGCRKPALPQGGTPTAATTTICLHFDFHLLVLCFCGTMRVMEKDNSRTAFLGGRGGDCFFFNCFLMHAPYSHFLFVSIWYFSCLLNCKRMTRRKRAHVMVCGTVSRKKEAKTKLWSSLNLPSLHT